jgi:hypothetical protein
MPDSQGYLLPDEQRHLLSRFAPVLVLFPEKREAPPYPVDGDGYYVLRGSYHPRSVEFFLQNATIRLRRAALTGWFSRLKTALRPGASPERGLDTLQQIRAFRAKIEQSITEADLAEAAQQFKHELRYVSLPEVEQRKAMLKRLAQERLAQKIEGFDLAWVPNRPLRAQTGLVAWKNYFDSLDQSDPLIGRSVVYGRLVQGDLPRGENPIEFLKQQETSPVYDIRRNRVALQYWFHYFYDDWANQHEGDWEGITILLDLHESVVERHEPLDLATLLKDAIIRDVGYAVHEDGYRRVWEDVQKTQDDRPIVYVARGSGASYFSWSLEGHTTSVRLRPLEQVVGGIGRFLSSSLLVGLRWLGRRLDADVQIQVTGVNPRNRDWVAADPRPEDRLDPAKADPLESLIPASLRGVRRSPSMEADTGIDAPASPLTYHLETDDLWWLEMVQEYGVQWGADSPLPGTKGPQGVSKKKRISQAKQIRELAIAENRVRKIYDQISAASSQETPIDWAKELEPLRQRNDFPKAIRQYIDAMWVSVLPHQPQAWSESRSSWVRLLLSLRPKKEPSKSMRELTPPPLPVDSDPLSAVQGLLAQIRYTRRKMTSDHEGWKWDNPFAWTRYICHPDPIYRSENRNRTFSEDEIRYLFYQEPEQSK